SGQTLGLDAWASEDCPLCNQTLYAVAGYWQQLGVKVTTNIVSSAQFNDRQYTANFPAFYLRKQATSVIYLNNLLSRNAPLPANNYVGSNYSRYRNPEFDTQILRFFATIDPQQRLDVLRPMVHQISDDLITMGLFFD